MSTFIEQLKEQEKLYSEECKKIEYNRIHTSGYEESLKGGFQPSSGQISIFTSSEGAQNQSDIELTSSLVHENGHEENANVYHLEMSPEQIYNVAQCDEIGQKMRELLFRRNEYLKTGDPNVFNDLNQDFSYYAEALNKGEIDPYKSAQDSKAFDEEMSFIMNRTMEEWQKKYGQFYEPQLTSQAKEYFCRVGSHAQENELNYNKAINQILNIGGVNFNQYRTENFSEASPEIQELGKILQQGDASRINEIRQQFIDEGISVIPSLQATQKQKSQGYLTQHNPKSNLPLEKSSEERIVTKEEKIKNLTEMGIIDGSEDEKFLELLGADKDTVIKYEETPQKKKIPDLSDEEFIAKPSHETVQAFPAEPKHAENSTIQRLKELRGLGGNNGQLGHGAEKIMQRQLDKRIALATMQQYARP